VSAADHLNAELFHGTSHPFEPGDVINPTDTEHTTFPTAWATPSMEHASRVARAKVRRHNRRNPDNPATEHVFAVEHMGERVDVWGRADSAADPVGFRVLRRVGP
jgi:hypothetical protein